MTETRSRQGLGLLDALATLHEMAHERGIIAIILIIAHVFFLAVELMPLVIKLSYKGSQYYDILDAMDKVQADYELKTQMLELAAKLQRLELQQTADQAVSSSEILLEALAKLNEIELEGLQRVDEAHASSYKQQMEEIVIAFLNRSRAILATNRQ